MDRVVKLSLACGFFGVLLLAIVTAVGSYLHGSSLVEAAANAFVITVFYGPAVGLIGAAAGFGAGLVGETIDRLRGK